MFLKILSVSHPQELCPHFFLSREPILYTFSPLRDSVSFRVIKERPEVRQAAKLNAGGRQSIIITYTSSFPKTD